MGKKCLALVLSASLCTFCPVYGMDDKGAQPVEDPFAFDLMGLIWTGIVAFAGIYLLGDDPEATDSD